MPEQLAGLTTQRKGKSIILCLTGGTEVDLPVLGSQSRESLESRQIVRVEPTYTQCPVAWTAPLKALQRAMKMSSLGGVTAKWEYHELLLSTTNLHYIDANGKSTDFVASNLLKVTINPTIHNALYFLTEKMAAFFAR